MAKRKRLTPPSDDVLIRIGASLAESNKRPTSGPLAPIASVAADAASQSVAEGPSTRVDAERYRRAVAQGMVVEAIPLDQIAADDILRDRAVIDTDEMAELKASITAHGLRLPVEVYRLAEPKRGFAYGLISGWRRLTALRELLNETRDSAQFGQINALIRRPDTASDAYIAMVEENEIRADISQYERGRIAVLAAGQGAFEDINAAVDALFAAGSRAKRSKIRSFALLHEALGDLLRFPSALSERQGLQLAGMVKGGQGAALRTALAQAPANDSDHEWQVLETALKAQPPATPQPGAPAQPKPARQHATPTHVLRHEQGPNGDVIHLEGAPLTAPQIKEVLARIRDVLG